MSSKPKIVLLSQSAVKLAAVQRSFPDSIVESCEPGKTPFAQPLSREAAFACIDARVAPLMDTIKSAASLSDDDNTTWIAIENYIVPAQSVDGPTPYCNFGIDETFVDGVAVGVWRNGALWQYKSSGAFVPIPTEYDYLIKEKFDLCLAMRRQEFDDPKRKSQISSLLGSNVTFGHALHSVHPECSATDWIPFVHSSAQPSSCDFQEYRNRTEQICAALAHVVYAIDEQRALERVCHVYKDYPKPGVVFRDVLPLLALRAESQRSMLDSIERMLCYQLGDSLCSNDERSLFVAGIESRGLLFGVALARHLDLPFVAIRKAGKLPANAAWPVLSATYEKEYGTDTLELQKRHIDEALNGELVQNGGGAENEDDNVEKEDDDVEKAKEPSGPLSCILVDDVLATGGSMCAAASLLSQCAVNIAAVVVIDDVSSLRAQRITKFASSAALRNAPIISLL